MEKGFNQLLKGVQAAGSRLTPVREKLLEVLWSAGQPLRVAEIQQHLGPGASWNLVTLYRNLQLLEELGIVHKIQLKEGYARFELAEPWLEHHHHLICNGCGAIMELPGCALNVMAKEIYCRFGFAVEQHTLDFYGKCANCQTS